MFPSSTARATPRRARRIRQRGVEVRKTRAGYGGTRTSPRQSKVTARPLATSAMYFSRIRSDQQATHVTAMRSANKEHEVSRGNTHCRRSTLRQHINRTLTQTYTCTSTLTDTRAHTHDETNAHPEVITRLQFLGHTSSVSLDRMAVDVSRPYPAAASVRRISGELPSVMERSADAMSSGDGNLKCVGFTFFASCTSSGSRR